MSVVKFRQPILPGQEGSDVLAVKRAMIKMGANGAGAMITSGPMRNRAAATFVAVLKGIQKRHSLAQDGVYGPASHAIIAPFFDAWGKTLYSQAKIRTTPLPVDPMNETAKQAAAQLLKFHDEGKYSADNPGDLRDVQATASGKAVWSQLGRYVYVDHRPLGLLVYLIAVKGYKIGTFAICSDHHDDGPHGHAGGLAVDISSINGVSVASQSPTSRKNTLAVATALHVWEHKPRQLICGGYGLMRDAMISAESLPAADSFYGSTTMREHCNHVHAGY